MKGDLVLRFELPHAAAVALSRLHGRLVDVWHEELRLLDRVANVAVDTRDPERCRVTVELRRLIA